MIDFIFEMIFLEAPSEIIDRHTGEKQTVSDLDFANQHTTHTINILKPLKMLFSNGAFFGDGLLRNLRPPYRQWLPDVPSKIFPPAIFSIGIDGRRRLW